MADVIKEIASRGGSFFQFRPQLEPPKSESGDL
jgi:hypothetical protein